MICTTEKLPGLPGRLNPARLPTDQTGMELDRHLPLYGEVEKLLDRLRPALIADGGNVELVGVEDDGTVRVSFQGACATCPAQHATLRIGLEDPIRRSLPAVTAVIPV